MLNIKILFTLFTKIKSYTNNAYSHYILSKKIILFYVLYNSNMQITCFSKLYCGTTVQFNVNNLLKSY